MRSINTVVHQAFQLIIVVKDAATSLNLLTILELACKTVIKEGDQSECKLVGLFLEVMISAKTYTRVSMKDTQ
jgi:hypothetical protein